MQNKNVTYLFFLVGILGLFAGGKISNAANLGFSVQVRQPASQIDSKISYLDLRLQPLQEEEIVTIVKNRSKKESLNLEINYSNAKTNSDGVIDYAPYEMATDKSLKFPFEDVVRGPKEIVLKPDEERELKFQIQMPKETFDGYIAGGIELKQKANSSEEEILNTEFSYVIGMRLSQNSNKVEKTMEFRKIQSGLRFNKPAVMIYYSNTSSDCFEHMNVTVSLRKKDKEKMVLTKTLEDIRMAPNSMMMFPVEVYHSELQDGKYMALIEITSKDGFKKT